MQPEMRLMLAVLAAVIAVGTPAPLASQLAAASAGSRVRVKAPAVQKRSIVGLLSAPIGDSAVITLAGDSTGARRLAIPASSIETLEVSMGQSRSSGAQQGVKVGALLALGVGAVIGVASYGGTIWDDTGNEPGIGIRGAIGIGVLGTGLTILPLMGVGAAVGSLVKKEKWHRVYPVSQ